MYIKLFLSSILFFSLVGCEKKEEKQDKKNNIEKVEKKVVKTDDFITLKEEAIKLADIKSEKIITKAYQETINTTGVIKETENSTFKINSIATGKIIKDNINVGDFIQNGQKIAEVQNNEVIKIYSNYIHEYHNNEIMIKQSKIKLEMAKKNEQREKNLLDQGISAKKDYLQAKTDYDLNKAELDGLEEHRTHLTNETKALLSNYGVSFSGNNSEQINSISPILATKSGFVTKKNINLGNMVTPDQVLYEISDLSKVYLEISLYGKDISNIKKGQEVTFSPESLKDKKFFGNISYINPSINGENKTFIAKVLLENKNNELKAGVFGTVSIKGTKEEAKFYIPENSLQTYKKENFIFIDFGQGKFKKVIVNIDKKFEDGYLIKKGLNPSDKVVYQGAFTLKSEMLKSQFAEEE